MILPEIAAVGIYNSQIAAKNTVISKNRKTSMFEIELPIENGGMFYIDSNAKQITTNTVICAKPGQVRHTKFPFKCYYIHMIVRSGTLYDTLMDAPDFFKTNKYDTYKRIFERIIKHYNSLSEKEEIILQSQILELIYAISKDTTKRISSHKASGNHLIIEDTLTYIKDNLTEDLSLEQIATQMSLSQIYFHTLFKASVGKTLRDYVEEQRIKKAITLLQTTDYSLTKIAFECGFSSQSYFSFVFKRRMHKTPREYAQELNRQYEM